jgi:hypothetical protein
VWCRKKAHFWHEYYSHHVLVQFWPNVGSFYSPSLYIITVIKHQTGVIESGWLRRQWVRKSELTNLVFIIVPGHAGVKGNERSDRFAETAIVGDGESMDRADILNAIREADSFREHESETMSRLKEHQVKNEVWQN